MIEKEVDTNVYYTTTINGKEFNVPDKFRTRKGTPSGVFGPISLILDQLKADGADIDYTVDGSPLTLTFRRNGHTYTVTAGENEIRTDGQNPTEIVQNAEDIDGELFVNLNEVFSYMGVGVQQNDTDKTVNIVYNIE